MATAIDSTTTYVASDEIQWITFYVGDLFLGLDINQVKEINRHLEIATVPHAPPAVKGVVNLRGDVVTIVDLRKVLQLPAVQISRHTRNVVVTSCGESIGLLVDRVAEVVTAHAQDVEPAPSNVEGIDGRYFNGVFKLETELLVILDVDKVFEESEA